MNQSTYFFANHKAEGNAGLRDLLGGKGANLHEMTNLGLPVPPGFTITTEVCSQYFENGNELPAYLGAEVENSLGKLEDAMGLKFGDPSNPLLVSVRSGARVSMPGMMDTVLNLGLNDETVAGLAKSSNDERFAYDAYRRFIQMYSDVVLGMSIYAFENVFEQAKRDAGVDEDSKLPIPALKKIVADYKNLVIAEGGKPFPQDAKEQLWGAIRAVFDSWMAPRAVSYRRINGLSSESGTAVNVQAMVFGNMGEDSATGVAFTRDPATGAKLFFGEFLPNAQGEDVVSGIRTPWPINHLSDASSNLPSLQDRYPVNYKELETLHQGLETHYRDMQDIEFTIQRGKLYLLQTRTGKRSASAAIRIAVDMVEEGLIERKEAVLRVSPLQIEQLLHPRLDPKAPKVVIAKGLPASPGAASGEVVFSSEEADLVRKAGRKVLLVRHETSPEDIVGMDVSEGVLTALGGMTSHAAVVARGMGKPCVAGCSAINIDYRNQEFTVGSKVVRKGDILTIDGTSGEVIVGHVPTINSQVDQYFSKFMDWVDEFRVLGVWANADTPHDVKVARQFGAEGVGLCRTEHMFFGEQRILAMREMILAGTSAERASALAKIHPMQKDDFVGIFKEMKGKPVTIRLLDPPLHEFLPRAEHEFQEIAYSMNTTPEFIKSQVNLLKELNPMLGHRGCRLAISYPEIYDMQVRAIVEAACHLMKNEDFELEPAIMIPFVGAQKELVWLRERIESVVAKVLHEQGVTLKVEIGTMIEIPRAALVADKLAQHADFFSFGTNDLTQMTLGMSRDDSSGFLPLYVEKGLYEVDPFITIDREGVGELMSLACERGRKGRADLKIGICGEQGGDTETIEFCQRLGFNYVSCSPFRVPVARLAAAQAALKAKTKE